MKPSEEINQLKARQREAGEQHERGVQELLNQRIYGLVLGYEDLNDHDPSAAS